MAPPGDGAARVEVRRLRKAYVHRRGLLFGERVETVALRGIDLRLGPGELFGLLGPNGAGKTTTVKILTTLLLPTAGEARVLGLDVVRQADAVRRRIGFVLGGDRGLYTRLSGLDNLRYFADLYRIPPAVSRRRIEELIGLLGLGGRERERVERYSRGMKQRLHLARGLLNDPQVLFLDEPTLGLDPVGALELRRLVRRLADEGRTVFLTSHYMFEAEAICDRIAVLREGTVAAEGTPRSLIQAVADVGVVEFEVAGLPESLVARLRGLDGVASVSVAERELTQLVRVHCRRPGELAAHLSGLLDGAGVREVSVREATLEDAYLKLVSR